MLYFKVHELKFAQQKYHAERSAAYRKEICR